MKKALLIGLPLVAFVLIAGGYVFSQPEPEERDLIRKHILENFPRSGLRLGIVLSDGQSDTEGVSIAEVEPNGPADKAGLKQGDVLIQIDGRKVENAREVREAIRNLGEVKEIEVEVLRDGKPMILKVTPEKRGFMPAFQMGRRYIGVNLQNLDPDLAAYFKVDPNAGLLITRVEPKGPAAEAGIHSGDILTHIDGKKVTDARNVSELIEEGNPESVEVTVLRHGSEMKMIVKPAQREMFDPAEMQGLQDIPKMFESPEFKSEMENLKNQLEDMKSELNGFRKEEIEKLREDIQKELKEEMQKLRNELKDKKNEL